MFIELGVAYVWGQGTDNEGEDVKITKSLLKFENSITVPVPFFPQKFTCGLFNLHSYFATQKRSTEL